MEMNEQIMSIGPSESVNIFVGSTNMSGVFYLSPALKIHSFDGLIYRVPLSRTRFSLILINPFPKAA